MSIVTIEGHDVLEERRSHPRIGAWTADLVVDATSKDGLDGSVTINIGDGTLELKGTAKRIGVHLDTVLMRVVAGAGGLGTLAEPKDYDNIKARTVLEDLLKTAGESLSDESDDAALDTTLTRWVTVEQSVGAAIGLLVQALPEDTAWRILPDGKVWVGPESWDDVELPGELLKSEPHEGRIEIGVELPTLLPGVTLDGQRVNVVEHRLTASTVRTHVWTVEANGVDRSRGVIQALLKAMLPGLSYYRCYPAKVVKQSDDKKTVDVQPDDPALPGVSKVPLWIGLPATTVKIQKDAYVLLGWKGGDPSMPFALGLFENGAKMDDLLVEGGDIKLKAGDNKDVIVNDGTDKVLTEKSKTKTKDISYPTDITTITGTAGPYSFTLASAQATIPQLETTSGCDHFKAKG